MNIIKSLSQLFLVCLLLLLFTQCQPTIYSDKAFYNWLNQAEHGLVKQKEVDGLVISAIYLPPEYLALRALPSFHQPSKPIFDSLVTLYQSQYTFLFTLKEGHTDSTTKHHNINSFLNNKMNEEKLERNLAQYLRLHAGTKTLKPIISIKKKTQDEAHNWSVYAVFEAPPHQIETPIEINIDLAFNDEVFQTGINHFIFNATAIQAIPQINVFK